MAFTMVGEDDIRIITLRNATKQAKRRYGNVSKRRVDDSDIPESTEEDFARARPAREVMPKFVEAAKRGRPRSANPKSMMSFRIDSDLMEQVKNDPKLRERAIKAFERAVRKGT